MAGGMAMTDAGRRSKLRTLCHGCSPLQLIVLLHVLDKDLALVGRQIVHLDEVNEVALRSEAASFTHRHKVEAQLNKGAFFRVLHEQTLWRWEFADASELDQALAVLAA